MESAGRVTASLNTDHGKIGLCHIFMSYFGIHYNSCQITQMTSNVLYNSNMSISVYKEFSEHKSTKDKFPSRSLYSSELAGV